MSPERKRILLTVDGSEQTTEAAHYLSEMLPVEHSEVVLFHVMNKIPEAFWDWEKDPLWPEKTESLRNWEIQQEKKIHDFMDRTRKIFLDAGFPQDAVIVKIQARKEGVARDLCAESQCNYQALVIGRRGLSTLDELTLGSIANKIVSKATSLSVWLIGGKPAPGKILLALDASEAALRAADYLGQMLHGADCQVTLLHVVRGFTGDEEGYPDVLPGDYSKKLLENAENAIKPIFEEATRRLVAAGLNPGKIATKLVTGVKSRAGAITAEAHQGGYGTIVVGRKGLSKVEEFSIGQVADKLTQLAKSAALWLVS